MFTALMLVDWCIELTLVDCNAELTLRMFNCKSELALAMDELKLSECMLALLTCTPELGASTEALLVLAAVMLLTCEELILDKDGEAAGGSATKLLGPEIEMGAFVPGAKTIAELPTTIMLLLFGAPDTLTDGLP